MPDYVLQEFDDYIKCGIHAYGFLRLKCQGCQVELTVAFSCKKRGFCPSCARRRMTETAAHLVDPLSLKLQRTNNVFPYIPYRQFVVSFPVPLRYCLNSKIKLKTQIHLRSLPTEALTKEGAPPQFVQHELEFNQSHQYNDTEIHV